jgi:hypothetical protein
MASVRRIVVDVLKPHDPPLVEFTASVADARGVDGATASLVELDTEVQTVELTVEGSDLDYDAVEAAVVGLGAAVHSVDRVACGSAPSAADATE